MRATCIGLAIVLAWLIALPAPAGARYRERSDESFALARTSFPATARFPIPAVVRVELRSDETLRIAVELYPGRGFEPAKVLRRVRRLAPAAFDDLLGDVTVLSNAEVSVTRGGFCRVLPTPLATTRELDVLRGYDAGDDTFLGEVERIAKPWCWDPVKVTVIDPTDAQLASEFQAKLGILATQILGRLLVEAHP